MARRIATLLTIAVAAPVVLAGAALADGTQTDCSIYNSGTDSYNACIAANDNMTYVTCVNNVYTVYNTSQNANSGGANSSNNTSGGGAASGSAVNSSNQTVQIGASCTPASSSAATTTPTPTPATPTTTTTPAPATPVKAAPAAAVLPETGSNAVLQSAAIGVALLAGALTASKLGMLAWRRVSVK